MTRYSSLSFALLLSFPLLHCLFTRGLCTRHPYLPGALFVYSQFVSAIPASHRCIVSFHSRPPFCNFAQAHHACRWKAFRRCKAVTGRANSAFNRYTAIPLLLHNIGILLVTVANGSCPFRTCLSQISTQWAGVLNVVFDLQPDTMENYTKRTVANQLHTSILIFFSFFFSFLPPFTHCHSRLTIHRGYRVHTRVLIGLTCRRTPVAPNLALA